ncbi:hypothetical protein HYW41_01240 [Candidatus Daviesbacteria bacterium]|nr:hypothetical protein [Candidatus Daviesbacteria bacterium]
MPEPEPKRSIEPKRFGSSHFTCQSGAVGLLSPTDKDLVFLKKNPDKLPPTPTFDISYNRTFGSSEEQ